MGKDVPKPVVVAHEALWWGAYAWFVELANVHEDEPEVVACWAVRCVRVLVAPFPFHIVRLTVIARQISVSNTWSFFTLFQAVFFAC